MQTQTRSGACRRPTLAYRRKRHRGADSPIRITWGEEITHATEDRLCQVVAVVVQRMRPARLVIDVEQCPYLSPEGLATLLKMAAHARVAGTRITLRAQGQPRGRLIAAGVEKALLER